jgi:hypothetical protein
VGNKVYRKYLGAGGKQFAVDEDKIKEEAHYDGKWVLTTNMHLSASEVAMKYKQLWMVEDVFRSMKSLLDTRPIYHECDDSRARILFVSGADVTQGTGRPFSAQGMETGMGRRNPRSGQPC